MALVSRGPPIYRTLRAQPWRVIGDVKFTLSDVHRVFMPEHYAERFRKDLPNYTGQLTFSDNI